MGPYLEGEKTGVEYCYYLHMGGQEGEGVPFEKGRDRGRVG